MKYLVLLACALVFVSDTLLYYLGWDTITLGAVTWMKIHPAAYIFIITAFFTVLTVHRDVWAVLRTGRTAVYILVAIMMVAGAVIGTAGQSGGGEMSAAVVTFLMPAAILLSLPMLDERSRGWLDKGINLFFIVNSILALAERMLEFHLIPRPDLLDDWRATSLVGTPLNGATLTGVMIVYLFTAGNTKRTLMARVPLIILHTFAMIAFGGRAALIATPLVVAIAALTSRTKRGERKFSFGQRVGAIFVILAAGALVMLPGDFFQSLIGRFSEDSGSAETRSAALSIWGMLNTHEFLFGINSTSRTMLMSLYSTEIAIEAAWIALAVTYGILLVVPLAFAMLWLFVGTARRLDRSAISMTIYFFLVTAGYVSFGTKTLIVSQMLLIMLILCRPRRVATVAPAFVSHRMALAT